MTHLYVHVSQAIHDVMDKEPISFLFKGGIGVSATVLGVLSSFQEHMEWGLRITTSVVGLCIGILTLVAMIRKLVEAKVALKRRKDLKHKTHDRHDD